MSQYSNLTSLANLNVGDVIIYNTATTIDLAGTKCKFEVIGSSSSGGYSVGTSTVKSSSSITFNTTYSSCFYLTNGNGSSWLYNRFIVAGNAGSAGRTTAGGAGGGTSGSKGTKAGTTASYANGGSGGTQTAGGAGGTASGLQAQKNGGKGSFGAGGTGEGGSGGAGWYGGGSGGSADNTYYSGGGGGSGYVLTSSSSKPSGYMANNDFILESTTMTRGGASAKSSIYGSYNIGVITIIETSYVAPQDTKLIYNINGVEDEIDLVVGDIITSPGIPTSEGYIFQGWYADSTFVTPYVFGSEATSDWIYIYAKLAPVQKLKSFKNKNGELVPCKFYRWNGTKFEQVIINRIGEIT